MVKSWYTFKTPKGKTLFFFNSESGEHRWAIGVEPLQCSKTRPDEMQLIQMCKNSHRMLKPKKKTYTSTETETEEYSLPFKDNTALSVRDVGTNTESMNALCLRNENDDCQPEIFSPRSSHSPPGNPFSCDPPPVFKTEEIVERQFVESNKESPVDNLFAMELSSVLSNEDKPNVDSGTLYRRSARGEPKDRFLVPRINSRTIADDMQSLPVSREHKDLNGKHNDRLLQADSIESKNTQVKGCYLGLAVGNGGQIYVKPEPDADEGKVSEINGSVSKMEEVTRIKLETRHDGVFDDNGCDITKFSISDFLPSHGPAVDGSNAINPPRFQCDTCKRSFKRLNQLQRHMIIHTNKKPHACTMCSKRFREADCLKKHIRTHTGEKPYQCSVCDKTFSQSQNLNKHMNIHTGNRPHKCKECGKAFSQHSHLARHKLIHTGEKPHRCPKCEKAYRTSGHLARHFKSSNHY